MKKFVIVGTQRTGSSAFAESLNMHPHVACGWEWGQRGYLINRVKVAETALDGDFSLLNDRERKQIEILMRKQPEWIGYRRLFRSSNKWIITPRISPALWNDQMGRYIQWLSCNADVRIIHIIRRDNIAWLRSKYISRITKSYVGKAYPENIAMKIPVREALKRLRSKEFVDGRLSFLSRTNPYLRIHYEDFLTNRTSVLNQTLEFLECDPKDLEDRSSTIHRQSSKDPSEQITNYFELKVYLEKYGIRFSLL